MRGEGVRDGLEGTGAQGRRQSNVELLRIVAMLLIVAHHFARHSGVDSAAEGGFERLWYLLMLLGGKVGVDVFVLISGYFLVDARPGGARRIARLWLQMLTYSVALYAIFAALGLAPLRAENLLAALLPVLSRQWWFASAYFVLCLFAPYLNRLLDGFDRGAYRRFLALALLCWCVVPTFTGQALESNDLLWFGCLYALGGYIRRCVPLSAVRGRTCALVALGALIFMYLSAVALDALGGRFPPLRAHATFFYHMQRLPALVAAVALLLSFLRLRLGSRRWINAVASATFGVYLLHENGYARAFLWGKLLQPVARMRGAALAAGMLLAVTAVYAACTAVELLRIRLAERRYMGWVDGLCERFLSRRRERGKSS